MIIKGKLYDVEIADVKEKTMNVRWDTRGSDILFYCTFVGESNIPQNKFWFLLKLHVYIKKIKFL